MLRHENIQSKIDSMIKEANSKNDGSLQEDYNEVKILLHYNHCVDIFQFLKLYSKVQLNELLVKIAIIYDSLRNSQLSLETIDESLKLIPNVPSLILYKAGLFVTMNKLDEAQKCLLKFKYLIREDPYNTYIYSSIKILYYYLLEYEENIILREISLVEKKFPEYYNNNVVFHFLKSKIYLKLSEKFKNIDKNRSCLYNRDSIKNKEIAFNRRRLDAEYLYKYDINKEKFTKILSIVYPNFLDYKPKTLVEYNLNFKSGFRLFFILFEITKIIKSKILINKQKKLCKNNKIKNFFLNNDNGEENIINSNTSPEIANNEPLNCSGNEAEKCQELISSLSKSVWLQRYVYGINIIYTIENKQIKEKKSMKNIDINNINYKLKTNYYIYEGYYSMMNLKDVIIENINLNNKLKDMKDSFSNDLKEDFEQRKNIKENDHNIIMEENIKKKDNNKSSKAKSNRNEFGGNNIFQNRLIQLTKNDNKININMDINNGSKDKTIRMKTETSNNNPSNLKIEKRKKINILETITDKIQLDNNRKINSVEKDLIYLGSNKNLINTKSKSNDHNINDKEKKQKEKNSIGSYNKNKKENNNIFTNATIGTKSLYTLKNYKKYYLYTNKDKNKNKTISENERKRTKEKDVTSVKDLDIHQEIYNGIKLNKKKNKNNSNKNNKYINNSQQNNAMKDLAKYLKKKDEHSNNKNTFINEKVAGKNEKELNNKILERRVKKNNLKKNNTGPLLKKKNEKYLNIDISPFNTINVKNSYNQKNISQKSSKNINKVMINNYYYKIKTYVELEKININQRSENKKKKKEKDNFHTIALTSMPKRIITTPTYKKLSLFSSPRADSKDKKKENNRNKNRNKK